MKKLRFFAEDRTSYAVILFFVILLIDFLAAVSGFGGSLFTLLFLADNIFMFGSFESLIISIGFICFTLLMINYAYRNNHKKKLRALGAANLIMSVLTFVLNSAYYPFIYMIFDAQSKISEELFNIHFSELRHFLALFISVPVCIYCFVLISKLKNGVSEKPVCRLTFRMTSVIILLSFVLAGTAFWFVCNISYRDIFHWSGFAVLAEELYKPVRKERNLKLFEKITDETDFSAACELLVQEDFIPHTEVDKHINDVAMAESTLQNLRELMIDESSIVFTSADREYISSFNECIIISPSEEGKVKCKKIIEERNAISYITKKKDIAKAKTAFEKLSIGEEKADALKKIQKAADIVCVTVDYSGNTGREVYELIAFSDSGFLSYVHKTTFEGTVVFEDSVLTDGKYVCHTDTNSEDPGIPVDNTEYTIGK